MAEQNRRWQWWRSKKGYDTDLKRNNKRRTTSFITYLNNPNAYDWPGIDSKRKSDKVARAYMKKTKPHTSGDWAAFRAFMAKRRGGGRSAPGGGVDIPGAGPPPPPPPPPGPALGGGFFNRLRNVNIRSFFNPRAAQGIDVNIRKGGRLRNIPRPAPSVSRSNLAFNRTVPATAHVDLNLGGGGGIDRGAPLQFDTALPRAANVRSVSSVEGETLEANLRRHQSPVTKFQRPRTWRKPKGDEPEAYVETPEDYVAPNPEKTAVQWQKQVTRQPSETVKNEQSPIQGHPIEIKTARDVAINAVNPSSAGILDVSITRPETPLTRFQLPWSWRGPENWRGQEKKTYLETARDYLSPIPGQYALGWIANAAQRAVDLLLPPPERINAIGWHELPPIRIEEEKDAMDLEPPMDPILDHQPYALPPIPAVLALPSTALPRVPLRRQRTEPQPPPIPPVSQSPLPALPAIPARTGQKRGREENTPLNKQRPTKRARVDNTIPPLNEEAPLPVPPSINVPRLDEEALLSAPVPLRSVIQQFHEAYRDDVRTALAFLNQRRQPREAPITLEEIPGKIQSQWLLGRSSSFAGKYSKLQRGFPAWFKWAQQIRAEGMQGGDKV